VSKKKRRRNATSPTSPSAAGEEATEIDPEEIPKELFSRSKPSTRPKHQVGNHHIVPSSRGGPEIIWNFFSWNSTAERSVKHVAWHNMFVNALPSEAIVKIQSWMSPTEKVDRSRMSDAQRKGWDAFFGPEASGSDAIAWIKEAFLPAEKKWEQWNARRLRKNPLG